ncbi:hypothetical protein CPB83DRAFT_848934 [Crepidotus variabilis]|uniref:Uncharacterized protein n=1 Tax=Crepidotus variabilis TaxID=179855 RepID=A0A9P6ELR1_9AGAR|nr:hypothetical protein CPB83DRAFT_848934 [Crepidotus variabilis]
MDRRYPQRAATIPPRRKLSLYQPANLPPGHIPPKRDPPRRRHGAPFGPWPFVDIDEEVDRGQLDDPTHQHREHLTSPCAHQHTSFAQNLSTVSLNSGDDDAVHQHHAPTSCWCKYPQSLYPNWTQKQQRKSKIQAVISREHLCRINYLDMKKDGVFVDGGRRDVEPRTEGDMWAAIRRGRPSNVHLRMLFVDNCSGPVLKMLGTRYNIEPFFFSSTIGWIPTRFQSNVVQHESDHLTIVFTFMRSINNPSNPNPNAHGPSRPRTTPSSPVDKDDESTSSASLRGKDKDKTKGKEEGMVIDTQKPLPLRSNNKLLLLDRLALHMVRCRPPSSSSAASSPTSTNRCLPGNTIISLHPTPEHLGTTAKTMHSRVALTGRSVYWGNVFRAGCRKRPKEEKKNVKEPEVEDSGTESEKADEPNVWETVIDAKERDDAEDNGEWEGGDPTFVFLSFLWYAAYAWDESLEALYSHICSLESEVIYSNDLEMTHELHIIQAHLLHFENLLGDFKKTVEFIEVTPNPSMEKVVKPGQLSNKPDTKQDLDSTTHESQEKKKAREREEEEERAEDVRREHLQELMSRECHNLLSEVARLERQRKMMERRLKNVMDLGFALINIEDSKQTRLLTEASLKDSAAMKQIAYLTMAFLPASFVAAVFGMNVTVLAPHVHGTIAHYIEAALPLTALTVWIVIAYQFRIEDAAYQASNSRKRNHKSEEKATSAEGDFKVIDAEGNLTNATIGNGGPRGGHQSSNMRPSVDSWSYSAPESIGASPSHGSHGGAGHSGFPGEIQPTKHYKRLNVWQRMLWPVTWVSNEYERRTMKAGTTSENHLQQLEPSSMRKQMASLA